MQLIRASGSVLLAGLCLHGCASSSSGVARSASHHPPRVENVDALHYALDLTIDPVRRAVAGSCTISMVAEVDGVTVVSLDLEELEVHSVREAGRHPLVFRHLGGKLHVELEQALSTGDPLTLEIHYGGKPRKGLRFVEDEDGLVDQVFSQGQCVDSRWWFPCFDYPADRATSEIRVRFPAHWTSVAAGERVLVLEEGSTRVEHWKIDTSHPTYLTTLCVGDFTVVEEEWEGVPLWYLVDPDLLDLVPPTFDETDDALAFFSELTGVRYPHAKYAQTCVGNFPHGGMENISAATLTENTLSDELGHRNGDYHSLITHEVAHQWFGDLLTCADWSHIWLNEGFATYLTALYVEHSEGVDAFRVRMRELQEEYTIADRGAARRPTVWDYYKDPFDLFDDGHAYPGGASRLHLLRFELGDTLFFEGLRRYVADNLESSVVTADLREAMEAVSGRDLGDFFDTWFHSAGYPELEVSWEWDGGRSLVELDVAQVHRTDRGTPPIFRVPVDVEVRDGDGRRIHRLQLDRRSQSFLLPVDREPTWVRFDKHGWLPARIASFKSGREWLAIAAEDDDVNGRRDATRVLGSLFVEAEDPETASVYLDALVSRLRTDPIAAVRTAAVKALGEAPELRSRVFLEQAARGDVAPEVRVAALVQLADFGEDLQLEQLAEEVFEEGLSREVMIAAAVLYAAASPATAFDWLTERGKLPSPHGMLSAGLVRVMVMVKDDRVLPELLLRARDERAPSLVRQAAVEGIGRLGHSHRPARDTLIDLLETDDDDYRLRQVVIESLGRLRDRFARQRLEKELENCIHSRECRRIERAIAISKR